MRIDAIRLSAFRRFVRPVAVEHLAAGINVLAGPNEMGKSTIFRALQAAFETRHRVTGNQLEEMRPVSGGEPLVEVDFTAGGRSLRIRKQFGRGNMAILSDLRTGAVVARNAEAEDALARLIGRPGGVQGPLGLVWVRQQRSLDRPDPDFGGGKRGELGALRSAVNGEIEAAAGGEELQRLRSLTTKALEQLFTSQRGVPKKGGPLESALRDRDAVKAELERAMQASAAAEHRLQEIDTAAAERQALVSPETAARRREELAHLEESMGEERERRSRRELFREALRARELEREAAARALSAASERQVRLPTLEEQVAAARSLQKNIARLADDLNADKATPQVIDRLFELARSRDLARAEVQRDPTVVEIILDPGGKGKIRLDGTPLDADLRRDVTREMTIAVPGIGVIRVAPPGAARTAAALKRADDADAEIARICADLGVPEIDDAKQRGTARVAKAKELDFYRARFSGLAPKGVVALEEALTKEAAAAGHDDLAKMQDAVKSAEAAEHVARERLDTLNASILSNRDFDNLAAQYERARRADEVAAREIERLERRIENLKSEQAGADEDGLASQVDALRERHERHGREVARLEADGKALQLLVRVLGDVEANARDKVFLPIARRLKPYLSDVFGTADLGFKDAFSVSSFTRDGERHDFDTLSDGTREQLSVLVRVAYAELLGDQAEGVPLVLDDPLVYSDDARLESLCRVLERAADKLQIVLLTCRPLAFQKLSGHRVSLTTWQPEETSAV